MNKRKRETEVGESEPAPVVEGASGGGECDSATRAKRVALRRLFGRCSESEETRRAREHLREELEAEEEAEQRAFPDENEDPLLDSVPVNMDPEQLGFLVCAQETLRFLHRRGLSVRHPVFSRLRSRFLRGLNEMANA